MTTQKVDRDYLTLALSMKSDKKKMADIVDIKYFKNVVKVLEDGIEDLKLKSAAIAKEIHWKYADVFLFKLVAFVFRIIKF